MAKLQIPNIVGSNKKWWIKNLITNVTKFQNSSLVKVINYALSITIAEAPPPPLQIAAAPILALFWFKTLIKGNDDSCSRTSKRMT